MATGDVEATGVVGACVRFIAASQFAEYGADRLCELGLRLGDA
jgi:hypothetical protein